MKIFYFKCKLSIRHLNSGKEQPLSAGLDSEKVILRGHDEDKQKGTRIITWCFITWLIQKDLVIYCLSLAFESAKISAETHG